MREIKFRGQVRKYGEKVNLKGEPIPGKWVYGGVNKFDGERSIIYSIEDGKCSVYSDTVCQYTGLKDKNGKEVYENDILEDDSGGKWKVYFEYCEWRIKMIDKGLHGYSFFDQGIYEFTNRKDDSFVDDIVIGNIYENPELLKGE